MKYRTLDATGDYTLGRSLFLTGREAVAQAILTRMKLLYGEWWEDIEDGLPLFERIISRYGGNEARQAVDLIISERILGTVGVKGITYFESTFKMRNYEAHCVVDTIYGEAELSLSDNFQKIEVSY